MTAPVTREVGQVECRALALLSFGPQPVFDAWLGDVYRLCEQKGLVLVRHDLPRPAGARRDPIFFAELTRTGQALMRPPRGGEQ